MGLGYYTSTEKVKGGGGWLVSSWGLTLCHALGNLLLLGSIILILWRVHLLLASAELAIASHRVLLLLLGQVRRLHVLLLLLHHLHLHLVLHL